MEQYAEESGYGKKKLLVPLMALMLCAVGVVGTGYAFSTQLDLEENDVGKVTVNVTYNGGEVAPTEGADTILVYTKEVWTVSGGTYIRSSNGVYVGAVSPGGAEASVATLATAPVRFVFDDISVYTADSVEVKLTLNGSADDVANLEKMMTSFKVNGTAMSKVGGVYTVSIPLAPVNGSNDFEYTLTADLASGALDMGFDAAVSALNVSFDLTFSVEAEAPASP